MLRERCAHLEFLESPSTTDADYAQWTEKRLDRWLVDWALRNGKEKTARRIAQQKGIEVCSGCIYAILRISRAAQTLVDIDLFMDIRRVEAALQRHTCSEALAWCSENKTALRKIKVCGSVRLRLAC